MIDKIVWSATVIAKSAGYNPSLSMLVVMMFYLALNFVEQMIERLIWGERFLHWIDPFIACAFIAYAALVVFVCAMDD